MEMKQLRRINGAAREQGSRGATALLPVSLFLMLPTPWDALSIQALHGAMHGLISLQGPEPALCLWLWRGRGGQLQRMTENQRQGNGPRRGCLNHTVGAVIAAEFGICLVFI